MDYYPPDELTAINKGDLIEFQRYVFRVIPYFHFAVYTLDCNCGADDQTERTVGDGITVGVEPWFFKQFIQIVEKSIRDLCKKGCRVNNLEKAARDEELSPLNPDVIVERAREFFRKNRYFEIYSVIFNNCEHFATRCRYGIGFSQQVSNWVPFRFFHTLCLAIQVYFYPPTQSTQTPVPAFVTMNRVTEEVELQNERGGFSMQVTV